MDLWLIKRLNHFLNSLWGAEINCYNISLAYVKVMSKPHNYFIVFNK